MPAMAQVNAVIGVMDTVMSVVKFITMIVRMGMFDFTAFSSLLPFENFTNSHRDFFYQYQLYDIRL